MELGVIEQLDALGIGEVTAAGGVGIDMLRRDRTGREHCTELGYGGEDAGAFVGVAGLS